MMDNTEQSPSYQQQQQQTDNQDNTIFLFGIFKSKFHGAKIHQNFQSFSKQVHKKGSNPAFCQ
jgi:hypothetical protein